MTPALLIAAAAALKVAVPAFDVQGAPVVLTQRLPEYFADALTSAQCAQGLPPARIGPQTGAAIAGCEGETTCIASLGRVIGADYVLVGSVERLDDRYTTSLKLISVKSLSARKHWEHHYTGPLNGIGKSVQEFAPTICKVINPNWVDPGQKSAEDKLADLSFDSGDLAPAPAPAPAPRPAAPLPKPAAAKPLPDDFDALSLLQAAPDQPEPLPAPKPAPAKPTVVAVATPPPPPVAVRPPPPPVVAPKPAAAKPATVVAVAAPKHEAPKPAAVVAVKLDPPKPAPAVAARPPVVVKPPPLIVVDRLPPETTSPKLFGAITLPRSKSVRVGTFVALGTAGAAAITGGAFGWMALSAAQDRNAAPDVAGFNTAQSSLQSRASAANIAFGVAGTAAITTVVLWLAGDSLFGGSSPRSFGSIAQF